MLYRIFTERKRGHVWARQTLPKLRGLIIQAGFHGWTELDGVGYWAEDGINVTRERCIIFEIDTVKLPIPEPSILSDLCTAIRLANDQYSVLLQVIRSDSTLVQ